MPSSPEKQKAWREANREKRAEQQREYRKRTAEIRSAKQKAYREANKERIAAYLKEWRQANLEKCKERDRAKYWADPDRSNTRCKAWREANAERIKANRAARSEERKETQQRWREVNREKRTAAEYVSHARRRYGLSKEELRKLREDHRDVCAICGGSGGKKGLCIDHDHRTGEIRGLLCGNCNIAIGLMRDSPSALRKAALYLERKPLRLVGT